MRRKHSTLKQTPTQMFLPRKIQDLFFAPKQGSRMEIRRFILSDLIGLF